MNATVSWAHASSSFHAQEQGITKRSEGSLEARFKNVAKVTQKYMAAERLYRSYIPSGESAEDTEANTMTLYRNTNKVKLKGTLQPVPEIRFMSAVRVLAKMPMFASASTSFPRSATTNDMGLDEDASDL